MPDFLTSDDLGCPVDLQTGRWMPLYRRFYNGIIGHARRQVPDRDPTADESGFGNVGGRRDTRFSDD